MQGIIDRIVLDRGFGFVAVPNGPDVFFHCRDLDDGLEFSEQLKGQRVEVEVEPSDKGPRATFVRAAE
jgi:CspA family cold shock protein